MKSNIIFLSLFLFACNSSLENKNGITQVESFKEPEITASNRTVFLIDHCDNENINAQLEEDLTKGKDTCILRINSAKHKVLKVEKLNIPVDRSSIYRCEKEYVVVGFACGGPCYSEIFIFTDTRTNKQFSYSQKVSNNKDIIAHIENEEFEKLLITNIKNNKELSIDISDNNWMNYGHLDTLFMTSTNLNIEYQTKNNKTKKRTISLKHILK